MASLQLQAVLRELDEQRGAISRLAMDALPESDARIRLLVDELRSVEDAGGAEAEARCQRLEAEVSELRRRERQQEHEIAQLRAQVSAAEARSKHRGPAGLRYELRKMHEQAPWR